MIAVGLSGGADSAAAAIVLHESGLPVCGMTAWFGESNPSAHHLDRAAYICRYLGMEHHVIDVRREFESIKRYFCDEYLAGGTPNPCIICNRDIKFDVLSERARQFGADTIATGHYVKKGYDAGRYYVARAREKNSQEYFLGLLPQEALERSMFPLDDMSKADAHALIEKSGLTIPRNETSQDVCFIDSGGYVLFIRSYAGYQPVPGPVLNRKGRVIGQHRGALYYTIGQRKGLGMGFGKKVYVLGIDPALNTVTVGSLGEWPYRGFILEKVNYMRIPYIEGPLEALVKVRYRQEGEEARIEPRAGGGLTVHYRGLFSPGQLAVVYDPDSAVLCAGIIGSAFGQTG